MKLTFSKSLISVATATLLVAGFAGCSNEGDTNAAVNKIQHTSYTASVSGGVMDDMGRPVEGATVTVAGITGKTDANGVYNLKNVPVTAAWAAQLESGYNDSVSYCDEGCGMTVSVTAGEGYNTAFAEVDTLMVHIENGGTGSDQAEEMGDINTQPASQSFTLHSDVGIVMLSRPIAKVTGVIRDANTGQAIAEGTKIIAKYNGVDMPDAPSNSGIASYANTVTSVNSVVGTVGAGGVFTLEGLLTSSNYVFILENYSSDLGNEGNVGDDGFDGFAVRTNHSAAYYDGDFVTNTGNVYVLPIVAVDGIAPRVAFVSNTFGMVEDYHWNFMGHQYNIGTTLMLDRTATNEITINFTEPMSALDIENSILAYSGDTKLAISGVSLVGNKLTVTFAQAFTDGQPIELYVMRDARLTDLEGNALVFNGEADDEGLGWNVLNLDTCTDGCEDGYLQYLSCTASSRALKFNLMAYKELNLNAEAPTDGVQMQLDTDVNRTASSSLSPLEVYSNAFNNVYSGSEIGQLNNVSSSRYSSASGETAERLYDLKMALNGDGADLETDVARIQFVAHNANSYVVTVAEDSTCGAVDQTVGIDVGGCPSDTSLGWGTSHTLTGFADGETVQLIIDNAQHGDKVVVTPYDDLCKAGTPFEMTLADNVAPTTVLQNSYIGGTVYGGIGSVVAFGEGGELTNPYNTGGSLGMPALYITPGLLDNLDAAGHNILEENTYTEGDESLVQELYAYNYDDNNYSDKGNVYDATDWEEFQNHLGRKVGVAFSEDIDLTGVTPTFEGTGVSCYSVLNNVTVDDAGHSVNRDLAVFCSDDILDLANNQTEKVMSFEGVKDLAGNAGDASAKVMVLDGMPPFVTRAMYDGETVKITFNEPIQLVDCRTATNPDFECSWLMVRGETGNGMAEYYTGADWTLSDGDTVLTIDATEFSELNSTMFSAHHEYDEADLYGLEAGDYRHAMLYFPAIQDKHGNSWYTWVAKDRDFGSLDQDQVDDASVYGYPDINETLNFAMISNIGDFDVDVNNEGFNEDANTTSQTIVWTFNQAVMTGGGEFFNAAGTTRSVSGGDAALIDTWFVYENGGQSPLASHTTNATISLDSTAKIITLTFTGPVAGVHEGDIVRNSAGHVFRSAVDDTQTESVSASANGPVAP